MKDAWNWCLHTSTEMWEVECDINYFWIRFWTASYHYCSKEAVQVFSVSLHAKCTHSGRVMDLMTYIIDVTTVLALLTSCRVGKYCLVRWFRVYCWTPIQPNVGPKWWENLHLIVSMGNWILRFMFSYSLAAWVYIDTDFMVHIQLLTGCTII